MARGGRDLTTVDNTNKHMGEKRDMQASQQVHTKEIKSIGTRKHFHAFEIHNQAGKKATEAETKTETDKQGHTTHKKHKHSVEPAKAHKEGVGFLGSNDTERNT